MQPTRIYNSTPAEEVLAVSLELSSGAWKVVLHDDKRETPIRTVSDDAPACRLNEAAEEIEKINTKSGLRRGVRTLVLCEAGHDGFWIQSALSKLGYEALICDPGSIPVEG